MEKSKIGAIAILVVLGAGLFFSKAKDAPAPAEGGGEAAEHHEGDGHDHGEKKPTEPGKDMTGGVKALKIEDLKVGTGAPAKPGDALSMNYKGTLIDGKMFDQSYGRGPFDFNLGAGNVIKGWDEGIVGMKVGGKRKLTIPADKGYGAGGQGDIPPNATLIFEVELLKINGK